MVKGTSLAVPEDIRVKAVTVWLACGSVMATAEAVGESPEALRRWMTKDWWVELETAVRNEGLTKVNSRLGKLVDKALTAVEDRLNFGDHIFDSRTGDTVRIPVKAQVAAKIANDAIHAQGVLEARMRQQQNAEGLEAHLKTLAESFIRFATAKEIPGTAQVLDHE